jgi:hypothetical protein
MCASRECAEKFARLTRASLSPRAPGSTRRRRAGGPAGGCLRAGRPRRGQGHAVRQHCAQRAPCHLSRTHNTRRAFSRQPGPPRAPRRTHSPLRAPAALLRPPTHAYNCRVPSLALSAPPCVTLALRTQHHVSSLTHRALSSPAGSRLRLRAPVRGRPAARAHEERQRGRQDGCGHDCKRADCAVLRHREPAARRHRGRQGLLGRAQVFGGRLPAQRGKQGRLGAGGAHSTHACTHACARRAHSSHFRVLLRAHTF